MLRESLVALEFGNLTTVQRALVERHPAVVGGLAEVQGHPDCWLVAVDCRSHRAEQVLAALTDWARFCGLPLRSINADEPGATQSVESGA